MHIIFIVFQLVFISRADDVFYNVGLTMNKDKYVIKDQYNREVIMIF